MLSMALSAIQDPDAREFLTQAFRQYHRLMFYEAAKYIQDPHAREDVVQNALVKAVEHIDDLMRLEQAKLPAYLVAITRNESISHLRHETVVRKHSAGSVEEIGETLSDDSTVDDLIASIDRRDALGRIWPQLTQSEQQLLTGRYFLGYSDAELAETVDCAVSSVRMLLTRARRHAARLMREEVRTDD